MRPLFLSISLSLLVACTADDVGEGDRYEVDGGFVVSDDVPLEVDAPGAPTYWMTLPVTGHGPEGGTLIIDTGSVRKVEELSSSGDFCIDVPLEAGTNAVEFEAISATGEHSPIQTITILQQGTPPKPDLPTETETQFQYTNIAANAIVTDMSVEFEDGGTSAALFDSDTNAHLTIRNTVSPWSDWMVIPLSQELPLEQIRVYTTANCPMEDYRLLVTDMAAPPAPMSSTSYSDDWTIIATVDGATSANQTIDDRMPSVDLSAAGSNSRFLAVEFRSRDCGPAVGTGKHEVTEIEVWGRGIREEGEPSFPEAPTCFD